MPDSVTDPLGYYLNNTAKARNLIEVAVKTGVKQFIFSSTAAVYGEPARTPIEEDDQTKPTNPYGRTKLAFEGLLESYRVAYGLQYTCLRYFNAAGADPGGEIGEDHLPESHLIPLVLQVAQGKRAQITIFGDDYPTPDGTALRDYIHVNDLAAAHLLALERLADGGESAAFNLGIGQGFSVREVIEVCRQVTGHPIPAVTTARRPGDAAVLVASAERARTTLGWTPSYTALDEIIRTAWNWHRRHPDGFAWREVGTE